LDVDESNRRRRPGCGPPLPPPTPALRDAPSLAPAPPPVSELPRCHTIASSACRLPIPMLHDPRLAHPDVLMLPHSDDPDNEEAKDEHEDDTGSWP
jgi:hypothetical protein